MLHANMNIGQGLISYDLTSQGDLVQCLTCFRIMIQNKIKFISLRHLMLFLKLSQMCDTSRFLLRQNICNSTMLFSLAKDPQ